MKCALISIFVFASFIACAQVDLAEKIYANVSDAVVRIYSYSAGNKIVGQGSGVILKSKRWVITNAHIAGTGKRIYAEHHGQFFELDSFIVRDAQADVMIIRIKKSDGTDDLENIPDIKVFDSDKIRIGQRIYTIGSPLNFENTISEGLVSGIRKSANDSLFEYLQISAPISEGSSGGAVLDVKSRLLGITTSVMSGEAVQNINFAIPINKVFDVAEQAAAEKNDNSIISFDSCYKAAYREMDAKHYDHALYYFKKAVGLNPGNEKDKLFLQYMIGRCFLSLHEPDSAIVYLEKALSSPVKKFCYYYLGIAWMQKKQYENSERAFLTAISIDTNYVDGYNGMALLFIRQNQLLNSMDWLSKAAKIKKGDPQSLYLFARVLFMMRKYDSAVKTLTDLIKRKPYYADAIYLLAAVYLKKGETDKSFILQRRAFELKPELRITPLE